jgi:S1-C subfamily serine protease
MRKASDRTTPPKCSYPPVSNATAWRCVSFRPLAVACFLAFAAVGGGCSPSWQGSVGAILAKDNRDGRLFVREAPPEMGAAKAGLQVGDEVVAIDGEKVSDMSPEAIHSALAGKVGSKVKLTVHRKGQTLDLEVERGPLRGTLRGA